ncbi:hypothetical protein ScPMuIL_012975 [Solemya velum]
MSETEKEKTKGETLPDTKTQAKEDVHSANNWESVDLGDDDRRQKFLRLMGASKKEHHGRFVIGDHNPIHSRSKDAEQQMEEKLEVQFQQSLEHKLSGAARTHLGLGFENPSDEEKEKQAKEKETESKNTTAEEEKSEAAKEDCDGEGRKAEKRPTEDESDIKNGTKKMKFVKSSS